jgi:hypothetical protein
MDQKDHRSPNLEVISKDFEFRNCERRQLPRLCLSSEQFRLAPTGKVFSVSDLSIHGMGVWLLGREDLAFFSAGLSLEGTLNLNREKYSVQAKVRNLSPDRIGCEFVNVSETLAQALRQLLDPVVLGQELKPFPSGDMNQLWYHGPSSTDVVFRGLAQGQYQQFTVYALGAYVQWDKSEGLTTGRVRPSPEKSEIRGIIRHEALLLDPDLTPLPNKLSIAKTLILSSNLPPELKNWCVAQLDISHLRG